jgi:hypothetical protein
MRTVGPPDFEIIADTHAEKRVECPSGWTVEAGVCLP